MLNLFGRLAKELYYKNSLWVTLDEAAQWRNTKILASHDKHVSVHYLHSGRFVLQYHRDGANRFEQIGEVNGT